MTPTVPPTHSERTGCCSLGEFCEPPRQSSWMINQGPLGSDGDLSATSKSTSESTSELPPGNTGVRRRRRLNPRHRAVVLRHRFLVDSCIRSSALSMQHRRSRWRLSRRGLPHGRRSEDRRPLLGDRGHLGRCLRWCDARPAGIPGSALRRQVGLPGYPEQARGRHHHRSSDRGRVLACPSGEQTRQS